MKQNLFILIIVLICMISACTADPHNLQSEKTITNIIDADVAHQILNGGE